MDTNVLIAEAEAELRPVWQRVIAEDLKRDPDAARIKTGYSERGLRAAAAGNFRVPGAGRLIVAELAYPEIAAFLERWRMKASQLDFWEHKTQREFFRELNALKFGRA